MFRPFISFLDHYFTKSQKFHFKIKNIKNQTKPMENKSKY